MAQPASSASTGNSPAPVALPAGTRIAAVVSTYHEEIAGAMLASARRELEALGLAPGDLLEVRAPGAFELPLIARRLAVRDDVNAVLCFGLVLKGETRHDEVIAVVAAHGIMNASLQTDKPILFGVLTCDTLEQAQARALSAADGGTHDKGREVARAAAAALAAMKQAVETGRLSSAAGFRRRAEDPGAAR